MKTQKFLRFAVLFITALVIVTTGCKKDNDEDTPAAIDHYKVMTEYMTANNMDLDDMTTNWVIAAADVYAAGVTTYYIIDIRDTADYNLGHIEGAVNCKLSEIVTTAAGNTTNKPILIVCYTGQTAAYGLVALRLSGYTNCKTLKFGMSSWNVVFDKWTANVGNIAVGNSNWSTTNTLQTNVTFSIPTISSELTTGQEILAERVTAMLNGGFMGITATDVLTTPSNYFINNYWTLTDVNTYGHISGAYRVKEDLTFAADGFKNLDKDATVVTYCWTGQTSALVTAYLTVLGYNAKTLKFGCNAMIYDQLLANKWTASGSYPYVQ